MGVKEFSDIPDEDDMEAVKNEAIVLAAENQNPFPAMTYVEGVRDALAWVLGESPGEPPIEVPE